MESSREMKSADKFLDREKCDKSLLLVVYKFLSLTPHEQIDLILMSICILWELNNVLDNSPGAKLATDVTHTEQIWIAMQSLWRLNWN